MREIEDIFSKICSDIPQHIDKRTAILKAACVLWVSLALIAFKVYSNNGIMCSDDGYSGVDTKSAMSVPKMNHWEWGT